MSRPQASYPLITLGVHSVRKKHDNILVATIGIMNNVFFRDEFGANRESGASVQLGLIVTQQCRKQLVHSHSADNLLPARCYRSISL
jgi:uncharacterized protein YlaN (UPF0358 family)